MGIRHWFRTRVAGNDGGSDVPPGTALFTTMFKDEQRTRALGEYDSSSYPRELAEMLTRRQQVAQELLRMNITDRDARIESIPRLRELLRTYPHPLVYEPLIHAYTDAGRYDEAKGVAFAARERRLECSRSEHPEIRAEVEHLKEWQPEDVDQLREERERRNG
jgi:hypothetical protein